MFSTVAGCYLELVENPRGEVFQRLGFLESY
jgi:hypothetical protein